MQYDKATAWKIYMHENTSMNVWCVFCVLITGMVFMKVILIKILPKYSFWCNWVHNLYSKQGTRHGNSYVVYTNLRFFFSGGTKNS